MIFLDCLHALVNQAKEFQTLLTGLAAILAAKIAYAGIVKQITAEDLREEKRLSGIEKEKFDSWSKKKRLLVLDLLNAITNAAEHMDHNYKKIALYSVSLPDQYHVHNKEPDLENVLDALSRFRFETSAYQPTDIELKYLTDKEVFELSKCILRGEYAKKEVEYLLGMWGRLDKPALKSNQDPSPQQEAHELVKLAAENALKTIRDIEKIFFELLNAMAPEVYVEVVVAKRKLGEMAGGA